MAESIKDFRGGRYQCGDKIGEGAFAQVYKGTDTLANKEVAIKILMKEEGEVEFEIVNKIKQAESPYSEFVLIHLDGGLLSDGQFTIIMPLMKYSLLEVMKATFPSEQKKQMVFEVLLALKCLHEEGIVHTDLKPENVLITPCASIKTETEDGEVSFELIDPHFKVCDFNTAKEIDPGVKYNHLAQTGNYRCPEVALGLDWDSKIDIFSLGAILAESLAGDLVFYLNEDDNNKPTAEEALRLLEQIEYVVGRLPTSMIDACPDAELVEAYRRPRDIYHAEKRDLVPGWKWDYRPNDPLYRELVIVATYLLTPKPDFRPDAQKMLELCFKEMLQEFNKISGVVNRGDGGDEAMEEEAVDENVPPKKNRRRGAQGDGPDGRN